MRKSRLYFKFLLIVLVAAGAVYLVIPQGSKINLKPIKINYEKPFDLKLGLDLQGGTHLVYEGDLKDIPSDAQSDAMASARDVIERRVNAFGVSEPLVQVSGSNRIIIELPGVKDINEAISLIGQTPFLEFREENPNPTLTPDAEGKVSVNPTDLYMATGLTGKQFKRAVLTFNPQTGVPQISLQFDAEGTKLFSEITSRNVGKRVAIFLDGEILSAPTVNQAITNGEAVITGGFTVPEAKELVTRFNSGALPVPIKLISQQNVGATLGAQSVQKSVAAGLIGFAIVALFMIIYYRLPGLLAVIALSIYTFLALAIFKIFGITLTLAGIAGFILSIGMAVDANILIFERMKEELRKGKTLQQAVEDGFTRAWLSVRDSNFSSLITTFILAYFGTSIIRGFAITLALGILISMFTAITVTRTFLRLLVGHNFLVHHWLYGIKSMSEEKK
ncbi:MAG: protein-export membrane protein SecD [Candidatus Doudnabacteria bacterium RIFCSPHIGHO2_02_FULL_42_25]|uniref:Protein translocase subunit SecD n=1 Tax=Candidatus Doudnabacteria bacterium RIFCSPHIGHO2_01_FULL_41_86 TaxID=1817821 RepID=A0A1F5N8P2_9BACT|nr:MAG: protein-export membrane protein SecD [Candidatus Doudnabacteria bacterium RIFCSPHIGHO2_01_FULL_41_86]OGE75910.1 MAG: protein-export membrane protein SecD [Candidatus Doudnabacteria bacterium RIFCSPHIGHO2_01_43_10]OGE86285.1 MAG: protein-export membrane protein SecD [Candidatus Doudnabacteria bacterium RIFCSPHIGHO2_12_FULL_42_22]OGE87133.1 MAG: protein-export membrane protein SecD [Candidatus Doudnabacteria bacterium RIFCSPHIGHO2_02_FULL_42_25]OGE92273.1 MAG: protein-export membrane prot